MKRYVLKRYDSKGTFIEVVGAPFSSRLLAESSCEAWNDIFKDSVCRVEEEVFKEPAALMRIFEDSAKQTRQRMASA